MLADGVCGETITESATRAAMAKATVVKKPKTFWSLTRLECIVFGVQRMGKIDVRFGGSDVAWTAL